MVGLPQLAKPWPNWAKIPRNRSPANSSAVAFRLTCHFWKALLPLGRPVQWMDVMQFEKQSNAIRREGQK